MSKGKLDNYKCTGQMSVFDYLETLPCTFSGHTCNKKELWKVADTLDDLMCPHVCCRQCNTRSCGARCNGSEEPKQPVNIKGICDDAYCPECDYQLDELKELDCEQCPECGTRLDWTPWHRANDE